jgi:hypothetical protein
MRRHHLKLLTFWILPLLLARALIPSGFMLSGGAGGLQLMFCPAGIVQPLQSQQQQHAGHHEGMHHGADHPATPSHNNDNAPCPYSLVASATPSAVPHVQTAAGGLSDEIFEFISAPTFRVGPARADQIRGPPSLS